MSEWRTKVSSVKLRRLRSLHRAYWHSHDWVLELEGLRIYYAASWLAGVSIP